MRRQAQKTDDNLAFVRRRRLYEEAKRAAVLDVYRQILDGRNVREDVTNLLHRDLRLSGIVKVADGRLAVRNRIYAQVFNKQWARDNMPGEEMRRQQRAFRQGVLRTTMIAASVLLVVSALAYRALLSESRARIAEKLAQAQEQIAQGDTAKARQSEIYSNSLVYAAQMRQAQIAYKNEDLIRTRGLLAKTALILCRFRGQVVRQPLTSVAAVVAPVGIVARTLRG